MDNLLVLLVFEMLLIGLLVVLLLTLGRKSKTVTADVKNDLEKIKEQISNR